MRIAREVALYNQGGIQNGLDDASKVATSFITRVSESEGIKVHNADDLTDYIQINSNHISMYKDNVEKMELTDEALRLGDTSDYVHIGSAGMDVYQGGDISASFGSTMAQIGKSSTSHAVIKATSLYSGMQIYGADVLGTTPIELANIGYGNGTSQSGTSFAPYYTFGTRASGSTVGNYSMAEGYGVTSSGWHSHAEGTSTTASESASHAEGNHTTASGTLGSHAEGDYTIASGTCSHAEGYYTQATALASHAGGARTIAEGISQTAIGEYNVASSSGLFIVGNGLSEDSRSNALKVDSNGNLRIKGNLYVGCDADSSNGRIMSVLKVTASSVSSLQKTITNSAITASMEVINTVLSNPSAQTGDWTVTTYNGSLTITGSISGTTDITLYLAGV